MRVFVVWRSILRMNEKFLTVRDRNFIHRFWLCA